MNALTEAITKQYQRQQELITERNAVLEGIYLLKTNGYLLSCLVGELHRVYGLELSRISAAIQALEGVRDATD